MLATNASVSLCAQRVLAAFQDGRSKLSKLYARYARDYNGDTKQETSSTWPMLLPAPGLKALLYDCGMFCTGDPKAHDELFTRVSKEVSSNVAMCHAH